MRAAQLGNRDGQSKGCPWPNQWPAQWLPFVHGDTLTHDSCHTAKGCHGTVHTLPPHDTSGDVHSEQTRLCHALEARCTRKLMLRSKHNDKIVVNSQPSGRSTSKCAKQRTHEKRHMHEAMGREGSTTLTPQHSKPKSRVKGQLARTSMCRVHKSDSMRSISHGHICSSEHADSSRRQQQRERGQIIATLPHGVDFTKLVAQEALSHDQQAPRLLRGTQDTHWLSWPY